ncbi:MAG: hypothetical protein ACK41C_15315 [Phenylobacterium sp.]|uniref:hypothetical protein n=1 Tax=Phenylobacterium sp. TaxID=1871053 RepID=UPI00391C53CD
MRTWIIAACAAFGLAGSALAQAPTVSVVVGPDLQKKAEKTYGVREVERLAAELRREVEQELDRTGVLAGGRVELTLVDARPNRPTMKQLGDTPGLSYRSFGVGGAALEGRAVSIDGEVTPLRYNWYETDIRQAWYQSTWADAERAFDRFARRLSRGTVYAQR